LDESISSITSSSRRQRKDIRTMMHRLAIALTRPFRTLLLVLAAVALQASLCASAHAQGTMGTVPDPISASELDGYARRLGLSTQQRAALEQFHEQYRIAFSALREGEIERFLDDNPFSGGGGGGGGRARRGGGGPGVGTMLGNIDRQAVEDAIKQLDAINSKIKALDNTLFDQIQTLVTEEQLMLMPGVRQARERQRYRVGVSRMTAFTNPSTGVDLSEMVANLALSPDERTNVVPLVTTYESSLTSAVRKLHDTANQATLDMAEKMSALTGGGAGEGQGQRGGRGDEGRFDFDAFRQAWGETMLKVNEKASDISELNRRTERSINAVLAPANARKLRDEFFSRAYPETRGSTGTARAFEVALAFEDLTEEQRNALSAMNDTFRASIDSLNHELADVIDANRKTQTFFNWDSESRRKYEEQISLLRDKRREVVDSARAQVESTLGPELAEQLEHRVAESREQDREQRVADITVVASGGDAANTIVRVEGQLGLGDEAGAGQPDADPFVPSPITARDLDGYAARLGLSDDDRMLLSGLHADYTDNYRQLEETQIKAVREAEQGLWSQTDDDGERKPPTTAMVDNLYSLRRQAIESIKQLDAVFFDDVQLALLGEEQLPTLQRVKQSRIRSVYNRGAGSQGLFGGPGGGRRGGGGGGGERGERTRVAFAGGFPGGGSSEAAIDLSVLVEQSKVTPTDPAQLDAALAEYEVSATAAFQTLFDASMRMRQTMEKMAEQFMRRDRDREGERVTVAADLRQVMEGDGRASREAREAMVNLNRSTLERVSSLLEAASAEELRQRYNRKAFPDVFRDRNSAGPRIDAALALADLSDSQREQLQTIATEFRPAYDALCNQLIDLERNAPAMRGPGDGGGGFDPQAFQERMRNREKIEFEREDLSDRMLVRLRATLTSDQIQRIGLETTG
jgi:hypothetical protein